MTIAKINQFKAYHAKNPHMYTAILKLCRSAQDNRKTEKWSVWALTNILRWDQSMAVDRDLDGLGYIEYKISNDFCALYSRLIQTLNPDLIEFFDTKKLKGMSEEDCIRLLFA